MICPELQEIYESHFLRFALEHATEAAEMFDVIMMNILLDDIL